MIFIRPSAAYKPNYNHYCFRHYFRRYFHRYFHRYFLLPYTTRINLATTYYSPPYTAYINLATTYYSLPYYRPIKY